jgi:hypothetical protein
MGSVSSELVDSIGEIARVVVIVVVTTVVDGIRVWDWE